jgi:hypothetical protein
MLVRFADCNKANIDDREALPRIREIRCFWFRTLFNSPIFQPLGPKKIAYVTLSGNFRQRGSAVLSQYLEQIIFQVYF